MKKILLILVFSVFLAGTSFAEGWSVKLPSPQKEGGMPLMEALSKRQSHKKFSRQEFDMQTVSNILWAAFGINREDISKRTIPTAKNLQNLELYVLLPNGMYFYNAESNELNMIKAEDYRAKAGMQEDMLKDAAMIVVYVEKLGDGYNKFNTGAATQNVGLYAASADLANVVVGSAHIKELGEALGLAKGKQVQVIQVLGYKG